MEKPLIGKIALVTGASRGIGKATALALANAGAHVVALARTPAGWKNSMTPSRKRVAPPLLCRPT